MVPCNKGTFNAFLLHKSNSPTVHSPQNYHYIMTLTNIKDSDKSCIILHL